MLLSPAQADCFFDAMDALLAFVNERFDVLPERVMFDYDDPLADAKAALVARELWDNVGVIDDFVAQNPYRLGARALDMAAGWKRALRGTFTLVRYQDGCPLLMNDDAVFAVCGISDELQEVLGPAPAVVEAVLLPVDDVVTYDGFLNVGNLLPAAERRVADEFEERAARGVIATAEGLGRYVDDREAAAFMRGLDELEQDLAREGALASGGEALPAGFHRGVLAGVDAKTRASMVDAYRRSKNLPPVRPDAGEAGTPTPEQLQVERAVLCASACVAWCGVVLVEDAYRQYADVYDGPFSIEWFLDVLAREAGFGDQAFTLWEHGGALYLVHYTLSREYIMQQAARWQQEGSLRGSVGDELDNVARLCEYLAEEHERLPMRPVPVATYERDEIAVLLEDRSVVALRDFLDERIPDGEDDFLFADGAVYEMVLSGVETGDAQALLAYADELGLSGCCEDAARLSELVRAVAFNLPSWEGNGWSARELQEQMTGRKVFYDERGGQMRVGSNDPCPCGSGLAYAVCCGR